MPTTVTGTNNADNLFGSDSDDVINGLGGNDTISSGVGRDTVNGGTGNDLITNEFARTVYHFAQGDGQDTITDYSSDSHLILSGSALSSTHAKITGLANDMALLSFDGVTDSIMLTTGVHTTDVGFAGLQAITFADNVTWDLATIRQQYLLQAATTGNDSIRGFGFHADTLRGGLGDDLLFGEQGDDTYLFAQGDGHDTIVDDFGMDHLILTGNALTSTQVKISHDESRQNALLTFNGVSDSIQLNGQLVDFRSDRYKVDTITFSDGVTWDFVKLQAEYLNQLTTSGNDDIRGFNTNDTLRGGQGNDTLSGSTGDDTYLFDQGDGLDIIVDNSGNDSLVFGGAALHSGNVQVGRTTVGGDASNYITLSFKGVTDTVTLRFPDPDEPGGVSRVILSDQVGWNADNLAQAYLNRVATSGADTIIGFKTNDTISGGLGDDRLDGDKGSDVYLFAQGDGKDTIAAFGTNDTLTLSGAALRSDHVRLGRLGENNDVVLTFDGVSDSVTLMSGLDHLDSAVGKIRFANGVEWDVTALQNAYLQQAITGGNDTVFGFSGVDTLSGGLGNDVLNGLNGNDVYLHAQGDGQDTILSSRGFDHLQLSGSALTADNLFFTRVVKNGVDDLTLGFIGVNDSVTLRSAIDAPSLFPVTNVTFANGQTWNLLDLFNDYAAKASTTGNDSIYGFEGSDRLNGGAGNDFISGLDGSDTYLYAQGDGQDTISDGGTGFLDSDQLILSGAALSVANLKLSRSFVVDEQGVLVGAGDITLGFATVGATITLRNQIGGTGLESISFGDGALWNRTNLANHYLANATSAGDDLILGFQGGETLNGGLGNDTLAGLEGDDSYFHEQGGGQDVIFEQINGGFDTLSFTGNALILDNLHITRSGNSDDVTLGFTGQADSVLLRGGFGTNWAGVEFINFGDGRQVNIGELRERFFASLVTAGDDVIYGVGGQESVFAGTGNDTLFGSNSNDTLNGGAGIDTVNYSLATEAVSLNLLQEHAANDGWGFGEELLGIENVVGSNFHDLLQGDLGSNTIQGGLGNDTLSGDGGIDRLDGGAGNDTADYTNILGGVTAELWRGTASNDGRGGNDVLVGIENLNGSNFNDFLAGDEAANRLSAAGGNDSLFAGGGNDTLVGALGNDLLAGGAGVDSIDGGAGNDSADYASATAAVTAELWRGTASNDGQGGNDVLIGIENLSGGNFNDLLAGDESANSLNGAGGNDLLFGGGGNDSLIGGNGNDLLAGGTGIDNLNGGAGFDTADYASATTAVIAELWRGTASNDGQGGNDVLIGIDNLNGGNFNDLLAGDEAANNLNGQGGNDSLFGGGGSDSLIGGNGNDLLAGGAGIDNLNGGAGIDTADYGSATGSVTAELWRGTAANDGQGGNDVLLGIENLNGGGFNDLLVGDETANSINGAAGNDVLFGGGGADTLFGGNGNDFAAAGAGNDSLDGGSGIDTVDYASATTGVVVELWRNSASNDGQGGADVVLNFENLNGGNFNDFLVGNEGANVIVAGNGIDTVLGGGGDDFINGGNGSDILVGGAGRDIYRFDSALNAGSNLDTVTGFVVADDTISLARSIFGSVAAGTLAAGNLLAGAGVTSALDADDFILYNSSTGALYYDADGSGAALAVQFAVLPVGLALNNSNFIAG